MDCFKCNDIVTVGIQPTTCHCKVVFCLFCWAKLFQDEVYELIDKELYTAIDVCDFKRYNEIVYKRKYEPCSPKCSICDLLYTENDWKKVSHSLRNLRKNSI